MKKMSNEENEKVTLELAAENKMLRERLDKLEFSIDDQEQRNRNYCLLLHGIKEEDNENTDDAVINTLNGKLKLDIPIKHIQRSHRVGPRKNTPRNTRQNATQTSKPRPIIFRFRDFRSRTKVFQNKRYLKGSGVSITESLTKTRYALYQLAINKLGMGAVWTNEGRVTTKKDGKYITIMSEPDIPD